MENLYIGLAEGKDIPQWLELIKAVEDYFPGLDYAEYEAILRDSIIKRCALVAKFNDTIAGVLIFSKEDKQIGFLAVHPDYRKLGIARKLVEFMYQQFPKNTEIFVVTYREGDKLGEAARFFYKSIGFYEGELIMEFGYPCQRFNYQIK